MATVKNSTRIRFRCNRCGQKYVSDAHKAGKKGRCKNCNAMMRAPGIEQQQEDEEQIAFSTTSAVSGVSLPPVHATFLWSLIALTITLFILGIWFR